ncbi:MAG: MFS transporter [Actinomycetota bacterium]
MDTADRGTGARAAWSLLRRNRDFRRVFAATSVSLAGDWFLLVALFGLILDITHSPLAIGLLLAAQDIPSFFLSPVGGALADRLDRRRLMVACDLARAVICLAFLFVRDEQTVWLAFPLIAILASFAAAFDPASQAALPNLVEAEDLSTANALTGSLWGTMLLIGSTLGGVVAAVLGRDAAIVIDAVSFALSAMFIFSVHRAFSEARGHEEHPGVVEATKETARYARSDHRVLALLAVKAGWGLAGGVLVLISVFARQVFHGGDIAIGLLMAARGVGALIGPFVGRSFLGARDRRIYTVISVGLATFGLGYVLLGLSPVLLVAMLAVAVAHLGGGAQWTFSTYGLQRVVPDRIRGRVFAFDFALITATIAISSVATGWLADNVGPRTTAAFLGAVAVVWAVAWTLLTGDVRRRTAADGLVVPDPTLPEGGCGPVMSD